MNHTQRQFVASAVALGAAGNMCGPSLAQELAQEAVGKVPTSVLLNATQSGRLKFKFAAMSDQKQRRSHQVQRDHGETRNLAAPRSMSPSSSPESFQYSVTSRNERYVNISARNS